ncbi:hypothetical protein DFH09DRAFT_1422349 [Mycena vulgaris]|nr:hypothetical protein DFH09DRAFT_1422349 [Mycena vulgaris]
MPSSVLSSTEQRLPLRRLHALFSHPTFKTRSRRLQDSAGFTQKAARKDALALGATSSKHIRSFSSPGAARRPDKAPSPRFTLHSGLWSASYVPSEWWIAPSVVRVGAGHGYVTLAEKGTGVGSSTVPVRAAKRARVNPAQCIRTTTAVPLPAVCRARKNTRESALALPPHCIAPHRIAAAKSSGCVSYFPPPFLLQHPLGRDLRPHGARVYRRMPSALNGAMRSNGRVRAHTFRAPTVEIWLYPRVSAAQRFPSGSAFRQLPPRGVGRGRLPPRGSDLRRAPRNPRSAPPRAASAPSGLPLARLLRGRRRRSAYLRSVRRVRGHALLVPDAVLIQPRFSLAETDTDDGEYAAREWDREEAQTPTPVADNKRFASPFQVIPLSGSPQAQEQQEWTGEWNRDDMQSVIESLIPRPDTFRSVLCIRAILLLPSALILGWAFNFVV